MRHWIQSKPQDLQITDIQREANGDNLRLSMAFNEYSRDELQMNRRGLVVGLTNSKVGADPRTRRVGKQHRVARPDRTQQRVNITEDRDLQRKMIVCLNIW